MHRKLIHEHLLDDASRKLDQVYFCGVTACAVLMLELVITGSQNTPY